MLKKPNETDFLKTYSRFHWFGDSWVAGAELNPRRGMFPNLVSDYYEAQCINHSAEGSTVDWIPSVFSSIADQLTQEDLMCFCLTDYRRKTIFTEDENIFLRPSNTDQLTENWYKNFDNCIDARHTYDKTINLLYLWCRSIGVDCFFANIFSVPDSIETMNLIPDSNWILSKDDFLARSILHIKESSPVHNDMPHLLEADWNEQEKMLDKFFKPNKYHPNLLGHRAIANEIIKDLNAKKA